MLPPIITQEDYDAMVTQLYTDANSHMNELVANIQAAPHASGGIVGELITKLQNDLLLLRNIAYCKPINDSIDA